MKLLIVPFVAALVLAPAAAAHSPLAHVEHPTLAQLKRADAHHRYVARHGRGYAARWHRKAHRWTMESIRERTPRPASRVYAGGVQALARSMAAARGWVGYQWSALQSLWQAESHWTPSAVNPSTGACGIPQRYPCPPGSSFIQNVVAQIRWGLGYIGGRHGSPAGAWAFFASHGWY